MMAAATCPEMLMGTHHGLGSFPCTYFKICFPAFLSPPPQPVVNLVLLLLARDPPGTTPRLSLRSI